MGRQCMKTRKQALTYGLSFPDTYQDAPFHDANWQLVRYKGNDKAFLWTYERNGMVNLNVKADPDKAMFWRGMYPSAQASDTKKSPSIAPERRGASATAWNVTAKLPARIQKAPGGKQYTARGLDGAFSDARKRADR